MMKTIVALTFCNLTASWDLLYVRVAWERSFISMQVLSALVRVHCVMTLVYLSCLFKKSETWQPDKRCAIGNWRSLDYCSWPCYGLCQLLWLLLQLPLFLSYCFFTVVYCTVFRYLFTNNTTDGFYGLLTFARRCSWVVGLWDVCDNWSKAFSIVAQFVHFLSSLINQFQSIFVFFYLTQVVIDATCLGLSLRLFCFNILTTLAWLRVSTSLQR